jgi:hypothetical protein
MDTQVNTAGVDMWNTIKKVIGTLIVFVVAYNIITVMFATPSDVAILMLAILAIVLFVAGIASGSTRNSPLKLGSINRAEFYGVVVFLVSIILFMFTKIDQTNARIDQIMIILMQN